MGVFVTLVSPPQKLSLHILLIPLWRLVKASVDFVGTWGGSVSSSPAAIFVSANPAGAGELPHSTDISIQHFSEDLGVRASRRPSGIPQLTRTVPQPVGVGIASPYLTVASLLNARVALLGPPEPVTIIGVSGM